MMLDDYQKFTNLDPEDMMGQITSLPDQISAAWELGKTLELPEWSGIETVIVAGMGGSAIGGDLLASYNEKTGSVPVIVHRDYDLPHWAKGSSTLVIASSHSGNTEETLSALELALLRNCRCIVVSTGGTIADIAAESNVPMCRFVHDGQPRAAVGFSFTLLLSIFTKLGLIDNPEEELMSAVIAMRVQQEEIDQKIPTSENPAKRLAGQLVGRWVVVMGSGVLSPVARRWKGQISEIAKAWSQFEFLPEADHNTLAGVVNPQDLHAKMVVLFLKSSGDHPRNILRSDLTRKIIMLEGIATDSVSAENDSHLSDIWTMLQFGDYVSYYLAMLYGADPTPVEAIEGFKLEMIDTGK